jgi:arylsulfatase A-like enzyme
MIIEPGSPTLPSLLQQSGYTTEVVRKWHLWLGQGNLDWNQEFPATPLDVGFDYSFILAATNDRGPCVYADGREVVGLDLEDPIGVTYDRSSPFPGLPTRRDNPELLKMMYSYEHDMTIVNSVSRIGCMRGGAAALWDEETMTETLLNEAVSFVTKNKDAPFFLDYALQQPHVPRISGPRFAGVTGLGPRGDVIAELDWCMGEMLDALDRLGLNENTIVIFSSDDVPVLDNGYEDDAVELYGDHRSASPCAAASTACSTVARACPLSSAGQAP